MIRKHTISVRNAWNGLRWALRTQPNYKIHLVLSLSSIIGGIIMYISFFEFLIIGVLIVVGLSIETVNTAIEEATDAIDKNWRDDIKLAKDIAAGAMLIFAMGAFTIACIIFIPRIILLLNF